jgi:hypothetical protein
MEIQQVSRFRHLTKRGTMRTEYVRRSHFSFAQRLTLNSVLAFFTIAAVRLFDSGLSRHLIEETIRFGAAAADGENPRFKRSNQTSVWNRARHAIVETFSSQTRNGARMASSRFAGSYGVAFISNLWYPGPQATTGWALRRASTALGSGLGFHLFEEFVPRKYYEALHAQH